MTDSQPTGATELSTVDDAAQALMSKWEAEEASNEEVQSEAQASDETESEEVEAVAPDFEEESEVEEPTADDALEFESIYEIAEALEVAPEDFLASIKGKVKVDGEESEISIQEALSGYQRQADYQRKTAELAEQRKQAEQQYAQQQTELQYQYKVAQASLQAAEQSLMQEFQGIDWAELEKTDPGTAALYRQKFQERQGEIQNYFNQVVQQQKQDEQIQAQQKQAYLDQVTAEQKQLLIKADPTWTGERSKEVAGYLQNLGFNDQEISELVDHRAALMVYKAMRYDQQQKSVEKAKAKVKDVPKVLKPNSKLKKKSQNEQRIKNLRTKLKKTGSIHDAAAMLLERM